MKQQYKSVTAAVAAVLLFAAVFFCAFDSDTVSADITLKCVIHIDGKSADKALDSDYATAAGKAGARLEISSDIPMGYAYVKFASVPSVYSVTTDSGVINGGEYGYIHELLPLAGAKSVSVELPCAVTEITVFGVGTPPSGIQQWSAPLDGGCDLLVYATHFDDDTLFFGAMIAKYCDAGKQVQVIHTVNHDKSIVRPHEVLDGLWTLGVRNYPVAGSLPDRYCKNLEAAESYYDSDILMRELVRCVRRFRPSVVVAHDFGGEYGHGAHMLNAKLASVCYTLSGSMDYDTVSAAAYGLFTPRKVYLHLYEGSLGGVLLDVRTPLASGISAIKTAANAMNCHISQLIWDFSVSERGVYDCRRFGLFYSSVGADLGTDDIFENI